MLPSAAIFAAVLSAAPGPRAEVGEPMSIEAAVARALARSPALVAGEASRAAARARVDQAGSAWLPRVGVEARYRYIGPVAELVLDTGLTLPGQTEPFVVKRELGSEHNADAFVTVGWRALDLGVRSAREEAARALVRAAEHDHAARAIEVAYATRVAYLGALLAADGVATTELALAVARDTRDEAARKKAAGLGNDLGLAGAELRVAELEARRGDALEALTRARATLASLVGVEVTPSDTLEVALATPASAEPTAHPMVARAADQERAARALAEASRAGRWPTLDVYARGGVQLPATLVETDEAGLAWVVGATLTWEAFDGGRLAGEAEEAEARAREAAAGRAAQVDELTRALADADARRDGAIIQLAAAERRVAAAEIYLDVARGAQVAGAGRASDVQSAEVGLDEARLSRSRALHQRALAEAQRRRALGVLEETPKETAP